MANILFICLLPLLTAFSKRFPTTGDPNFLKSEIRNPMKLRAEKLSHFRFYWHDTSSGSNPTAVNVVPMPPNNTNSATTGFGMINMFDDPLTVTHELESKLLGRAQGLYAVASQGESALMMAMNFVFTTRKYNGSTLTILGWNPIFRKVREMPVIGGSGLFRFARGYVLASTYSFDLKTGDAVVEYNAHVLHY